ncbi:metallophosphoesterase [Alkalimonas sp. MEB108]|uniref:Metallophosphoesterase n=1 Tax=Alkalimonas cellulosilytica TaxID=3058395 RepID=A0ABU7J2T2_9GAMM|nr:metallophosphoesterase [Alkalimonas sp. MEB108]MEE2000320.1 metallophosphoesterase [Alkalimonas sp. MEB108]
MFTTLLTSLLLLLPGAATAMEVTASEQNTALRIALMGDINGRYGSTEYPLLSQQWLQLTLERQPQLILSIGDVIAGQKKELSSHQVNRMWYAFEQYMLHPIQQQGGVWLPVIGNHDGSRALSPLGHYLFAMERQQAEQFWQRHRPQSSDLQLLDDSHYPFYYSLLWHDIAIVVIDASGATLSTAEQNWLTATLNASVVQDARFRLVVGHLPLVAVAEGRMQPGERLEQTEFLLDVMQTTKVDWYISGHQHAFYKAKLGHLGLLMAGGVPARRLLSASAPRHVMTMLHIGQEIRFKHWDLEHQQPFSLDELPPFIDAQPIPLWRWPKQSLTYEAGSNTTGKGPEIR